MRTTHTAFPLKLSPKGTVWVTQGFRESRGFKMTRTMPSRVTWQERTREFSAPTSAQEIDILCAPSRAVGEGAQQRTGGQEWLRMVCGAPHGGVARAPPGPFSPEYVGVRASEWINPPPRRRTASMGVGSSIHSTAKGAWPTHLHIALTVVHSG